ncbi:Tripartite DNA replication factor [Mortierella antarctica]|nr:Tripartite DNA replication factor [Mortierella antarctica]
MKRSVSSASLSSKGRKQPEVSKLSQAPKPAEPKSAVPESTGISVAPKIPVTGASATSTSTSSEGSTKISLKPKPRPKTIIVDDDDDVEEKCREKQQQVDSNGSNNNTNDYFQDPSAQRKSAAPTSVRHKHLVPFEELSPPGSPKTTKLLLIEEKTISKSPTEEPHTTKHGIVPDQTTVTSTTSTSNIDKPKTLTSQNSPQKVTPQKATSQNVTPQKPTPSSNTFRTPTEKLRRKAATFESLGLSPEDSVFWVKTPPMEAFKKLASLNTGRSHEEEIASIVGRLYQNSSAGSALQSMDCGPKDRIRNMLDTLRGSNSNLENQDDEEYDDPDKSEHHPSPTRNIASRKHLMTGNRKEPELPNSPAQTVPRKRGRNNRSALLQLARGKSASQAPAMTRPRAEVLRMIEQLKTNMEENTITANASPDDFGSFLDFEIGEEDLEELTQLEMSATMSAASSNLSTISCPLSSRSSTAEVPFPRAGMPGDGSEASDIPNPHQSSAFTHDQPYDDDNLDDVADFFMDDFDMEDETPPKVVIDGAKYRRYRVESVQKDAADPRWPGLCMVINGQEDGTENKTTIYLRESWISTSLSTDDIFHTVGALVYPTGERVIDNTNGFIIVKPDNLISTTVLADSFNCIRKSIVESRIIKPYDLTLPLIHGNVLHELFQQCLRTNDFSTRAMESRIDSLVEDHLKELCLINESVDVARNALREQIPNCQMWARRFLRPTPANDAVVTEHLGQNIDSRCLSINKILDIEENIWSPTFGLKGKIDATVQVVLRGGQNDGATLTVPLELKTGKKSKVMSHRAQTMLYTLLMTDRYDVDVRWGLLFYMKTGEFIRVSALRDEIRTIMIHRNKLALYEEQKQVFPPVLKDEQTCKRCFSSTTCMVIHKLLEGGSTESASIGPLFDEITEHLNKNHAEFLSKWNNLLTLEHGDISKFRTQIWSMTSSTRQASGNCFSYMVLTEALSEDNLSGAQDFSTSGPFGRHRYRFKSSSQPTQSQIQNPSPSHNSQTLSQSISGGHTLLGSSISVGDPIVVSSENQQYALAVGYVLDLSLTEVTVGLDRPLLGPPLRLSGFDSTHNQTYRGIYDLSGPAPIASSQMDYQHHLNNNSVMFRIDKDEMAAGLARTRNNLIQLFQAEENDGDCRRRRLIVDLEAPEFDRSAQSYLEDADLNSDQRTAVETVLAANDYALILGMPGTGKTTTIAQIIHTLVARGKSVLLTSYTHSAVDNVLLKLRSDINIIRIGSKSKVHRDIQRFVPDFSQPPLNTVEAVDNFYAKCQVVGTTCLGIGDAIFAKKRFDYCIVDEASQITLPVCLGPIRHATVFVLVGDHNQLPPLVKNQEARENGYEISLFRMLSEQHPQAIASLAHQYRMNKHIMLLSNTLVYENRLRCANEQVANKTLDIPSMDTLRMHCHDTHSSGKISEDHHCPGQDGNTCWLEQVADPERSVVFVDTDDVPAREMHVGNTVRNPTEALFVRQFTEALISGGIAEDDIGIISVYRAQLKVLTRLFRHRPLLDIHTVDRYQGKDKDCVIVSLVRSNNDQEVGELLKDWRRINVAFTRAKKKLVVFGSRQTLQGSPIFEKFLSLMNQQDWILKLPPSAQHHHPGLSHSGPLTKAITSRHGRALSVVGEGGSGEEEEQSDKENGRLDPVVNEKKAPQPRKASKVIRAKEEVILKGLPVMKNIYDGL